MYIKGIWQNLISIHDKCYAYNSATWTISQYNKDYLWQSIANMLGRETWTLSIKNKNNTGLYCIPIECGAQRQRMLRPEKERNRDKSRNRSYGIHIQMIFYLRELKILPENFQLCKMYSPTCQDTKLTYNINILSLIQWLIHSFREKNHKTIFFKITSKEIYLE